MFSKKNTSAEVKDNTSVNNTTNIETENKNVSIVSPWVDYYRQIEALFNKDPEINVVFDDDAPEVKLYVESSEKADALMHILPTEQAFGNVVLKITIIPADEIKESKINIIKKAFKGNPVVSFIKSIEGISTNPFHYVVFRNEVVQYYNDDLSDFYGNKSTLYQDIANNIIGESEGVYFCTDKPSADKSSDVQ
jgi:hypothetical protein